MQEYRIGTVTKSKFNLELITYMNNGVRVAVVDLQNKKLWLATFHLSEREKKLHAKLKKEYKDFQIENLFVEKIPSKVLARRGV